MKEFWTGKTVSLYLTLKFDLDPGPSHTGLAHCTPSHDGEHLTLKYDIDLGPSQMVLVTALYIMAMYMHTKFQVIPP